MPSVPSAPRRFALPAIAIVGALALLAPRGGLAQQDEAPKAQATFSAARLGPESAEVRITLEVDAGWHVYATATPNGSPTAIALELPEGVTKDGPLVEPAPHDEEMQYVGPLRVHRGTVVFVQKLRVGPGAAKVGAKVTFQACDDGNTQCKPDVTSAAEVEVPAASAVPAAPAGQASVAPVGTTGAAPTGSGLHADAKLAWAGEGKWVVVSAALVPPSAPPGGAVDLVVELALEAGVHVYATTTPAGAPTTIAANGPGVAAEGGIVEPTPLEAEKPHFGVERFHEGAPRFVQRLRVAKDAAKGALPVKVAVAWQACTSGEEGQCEPGEASFELPLTIDPAATGAVTTAAAPAAPGTKGTVVKGDTGAKPAEAGAQDLPELAVAAFVLGLLMLLQPCTYPMIPITVSIFSKGKKLPRRQAIGRAGVYALGIVLSFVIIGGLVQVAFGAGGQGKLNDLAVNPWVNLVIGGLFIYFAFSFFGYYELGLPQPLMNLMQLGNARRDDDGLVPWWSLFLMGSFFVLTSYTCGAPIVLALFSTSASASSPGAVLFATTVFAITVAAPFFALSLAPGAVRSLPKSGEWFSVFKAVLGFAELAFALKFLRGANVAWELPILSRPVFLVLWTALSLGACLYLIGRFPKKLPHDPDLKEPSTARGFFGALFLVTALYFASGITGRHLHPNIESFILQDLSAEDDSIRWGEEPAAGAKDERLPYRISLRGYEQALERTKSTGKPTLLIFTGQNCSNCVAMEHGVLAEPEVQRRIAPLPRVALYTDWSPGKAEHKKLMEEEFRTTTLPSFYLMDADGKVIAQQNGGTTLAKFVEFLERGGAK